MDHVLERKRRTKNAKDFFQDNAKDTGAITVVYTTDMDVLNDLLFELPSDIGSVLLVRPRIGKRPKRSSTYPRHSMRDSNRCAGVFSWIEGNDENL